MRLKNKKVIYCLLGSILLAFIQANIDANFQQISLLRAFALILLLVFITNIRTKKDNDISRNSKYEGTLDKIIDFAFIVLLLSPLVVYIITILISLYPGFLAVSGPKDAWIQFSGSLIGGILTVFVVVFTIQYGEIERERDKLDKVEETKMNIMPIPTVSPIIWENKGIKVENGFLRFRLSNNSNNNMFLDTISVKNTNSVLLFTEKGCNYPDQEFLYASIISPTISVIPSGGSIPVFIDLNGEELDRAFLKSKSNELVLLLRFSIKYSDIRRLQGYVMPVSVQINIERKSPRTFFFSYDEISHHGQPERIGNTKLTSPLSPEKC